MSSKRDKMLGQVKQNKINRVTKKEKKYKKTERSKSDQAYIDGNYKSSVSKRSYGIKKQIAEGVDVQGYGKNYVDTKGMSRGNYYKMQNGENPYEAKYAYVGGKPRTITNPDGTTFQTRTRNLTKHEKESIKNTGVMNDKNYRKAKSYWDTDTYEGGKFTDRRKTFDGDKIKWDGLGIAMENQKDGKHLKNLGHLGMGLAKDVIADPIFDVLKTFDLIESGATNALWGTVEQAGNVLSGQGWDKGLIKNSVKDSIKESGETGWGRSSADAWRGALKRDGIEPEGIADAGLGVGGLVFDVMNPIDIGGKVVGVGKALTKLLKNLDEGADVASSVAKNNPGILPPEMQKFVENSKVRKGANNNFSDDVFYAGEKMDSNHLTSRLDNSYNNAVTKSDKPKIETGKSALDNMLKHFDGFDNKVDSVGSQRNIDGRTLNKKYTQTKDGYVPKGREVEEVTPNNNVDSSQIGFFDAPKRRRKGTRPGELDVDVDEILGLKNSKTGKNVGGSRIIDKYVNDVDELGANKRVLRNVQRQRSVRGTDRAKLDMNEALYKKRNDMLNGHIPYDDEFMKSFKKQSDKLIGEKDYKVKPKSDAEMALREDNAIDDILNIFNKKKTKLSNSVVAKKAYSANMHDLTNNIYRGDVDYDELSKELRKVVGNDIHADTSRKALNKLLFNGEDVLVSTSKKDYKELIESLDEIDNVSKAFKNLDETGEIVDVKLSKLTRDMLGMSDGDGLTSQGLKIGDKIISDNDEVLKRLSKALNNKSRSLTDRRYWEKQELLGKVHKYKKFGDVKKAREDALKEVNRLKKMYPNDSSKPVIREAQEKYNKLDKVFKERGRHYDSITDLTENQFDEYISKNYPEHMKGMKVYSHQAKQKKLIENLQKNENKNYKEVYDAKINEGRGSIGSLSKDNYELGAYADLDPKDFNNALNSLMKSYENGSLKPSKMSKEEQEMVRYGLARTETSAQSKLKDIVDDRNVARNTEKGYYEKLKDKRKEYKLGSVYPKATPYIPADKMNYDTLTKHKDTKNAIANIKATIYNAYKIKFTGGNTDEIDILMELRRENINALREMGIPDDLYFNEMKNISLQMLDYTKKKFKKVDKYKPKSTDSIHNAKVNANKEKNLAKKKIALSDKMNNRWGIKDAREGRFDAHTTFDIPSGIKLLDSDYREMTKLDKMAISKSIDDEYERVLKSNNPKDIIEGTETKDYHSYKPQSGDNMTKLPQQPKRKKGNAPNGAKYGKKTPLDNIASDDDFNPFAKFESYDDVDMETGEIIPKERRAKTKEEIAEIDEMIARGNARYGKAEVGTDKTLPKISELIDMGHSKDEAIKLYEGMRDGIIEVPEIKYKKDTKIRDGVEYTDSVRDISSVEKLYGKPKEDDLTVLERMFGSTKDINYGNKTPGYKPLKQDKPKVNKVDDVDMSNTNKWGEVVEETPLDKASNTITRADKGSTKFKDKTDKELMSYVRNGTKKQQKNAKKILKSRGVDVPVEKKSNRTRLEQITKGNEVIESNKKQLKYNEIERSNEEAMKKAGWKRSEPTEDVNHNTNPFTGEILKDGEKINPFGDLKPNPNALDKIPDDKPNVWDTRPTDKSIIKRTPKEQATLDRKMRVNKAKRTGDKSELITGDTNYGVNPFTGEVLEEGDKVNPMTGDTIKKGDPKAKNINNASDAMRASDDVPKEVMDELAVETEELAKEGVDATQQPPSEKPKGMSDNLYKRWLTSWKKGVTVYNFGWHAQNFVQNKAQNYMKFGNKAFKPQTNAKQILKTIQGESAKPININGLDNKELARLAQELDIVDGFIGNASESKGLIRGLEDKIDNSGFMKKLGESEQLARLNHFTMALEEGMSPQQAKKSVNKYLYDYNDKSKVDSAISDYVDPFWMFHKNNARMLTQSAIEHPSRMNNIMRGGRGLEGDIPEDEKQSEDSKWREYQANGMTHTDSKGRQYNYLFDQSIFNDIRDAVPTTQEGVEGKLNPLLQIALRTARGEGKFGTELVDSDTTYAKDGFDEMAYEDVGFDKKSYNQAIKDAILDVNPFMPTVVNTIDKGKSDQYKVDNDKMEQMIADKRALNEWLKLITGNKGNWYRNLE